MPFVLELDWSQGVKDKSKASIRKVDFVAGSGCVASNGDRSGLENGNSESERRRQPTPGGRRSIKSNQIVTEPRVTRPQSALSNEAIPTRVSGTVGVNPGRRVVSGLLCLTQHLCVFVASTPRCRCGVVSSRYVRSMGCCGHRSLGALSCLCQIVVAQG